MSAKHTTLTLECIGTLVRTTRDHGGFLVAEFRDQDGNPHTDEAKANARLFVAAHELLEALEGAYALAVGHAATYQFQHQLNAPHKTHQAILDKARVAIAKATGGAA